MKGVWLLFVAGCVHQDGPSNFERFMNPGSPVEPVYRMNITREMAADLTSSRTLDACVDFGPDVGVCTIPLSDCMTLLRFPGNPPSREFDLAIRPGSCRGGGASEDSSAWSAYTMDGRPLGRAAVE